MTLTDIAGLQPPAASKAVRVPMSEVLAAMSRALDLTEGQPLGHSIRSCMIGMELGRAMGLNEYQLSELYYALLLKDAGCSSNAARMAALFGSDELRVKPKKEDPSEEEAKVVAPKKAKKPAAAKAKPEPKGPEGGKRSLVPQLPRKN